MSVTIDPTMQPSELAGRATRATRVAAPATIKRRHDLDSLRAIAMLLGIVLHAAVGFSSIPWVVNDSDRSKFYDVLFYAIHGFRMPLFFLVSGFFTAMLWRKRGLGGLTKQRARRILLPLFVGCLTIVPAMWAVSSFVAQPSAGFTGAQCFDAVALGDVETVRNELDAERVALDTLHPTTGSSLLAVAAFSSQAEVMEVLLEKGADVNQPSADGSTPLHIGVFMGNVEESKMLLEAGANKEAVDANGKTPVDNLSLDFATTNFIAQMFGISLDENELNANRAKIAALMGDEGAVAAGQGAAGAGLGGLYGLLFLLPAFMHLWFLAFLCWLLIGFVGYAAIARFVNFTRIPKWLFCSPISLLWLIPLTMLPQFFMQVGMFGPDPSVGLLPIPGVLVYYAIFFFFGAIYWDLDDQEGVLGQWWYISLPVALLVVFPIALDIVTGAFGFVPRDFAGSMKPLIGNLLQAVFVWLMVFGSIGMFRQLFSEESRTMRYISDSSYWLYLVHLPLLIIAQWFVRDLPIPAILKFIGITVVVSAFLMLTYEYLVRYTIIGRMLNGPKKRVRASVSG